MSDTTSDTDHATATSPDSVPVVKRADLWTGLACLAFGGAVIWLGLDYPIGKGGRIGPGYVPRLLGVLLMAIGLLLAARSLFTKDGIETTFAPRAVLLVLASVLAFAATFAWAGLVPAILVAVTIANFAAPDNDWKSALGLGLLLALFAWALFVKALRLPMPVFWF